MIRGIDFSIFRWLDGSMGRWLDGSMARLLVHILLDELVLLANTAEELQDEVLLEVLDVVEAAVLHDLGLVEHVAGTVVLEQIVDGGDGVGAMGIEGLVGVGERVEHAHVGDASATFLEAYEALLHVHHDGRWDGGVERILDAADLREATEVVGVSVDTVLEGIEDDLPGAFGHADGVEEGEGGDEVLEADVTGWDGLAYASGIDPADVSTGGDAQGIGGQCAEIGLVVAVVGLGDVEAVELEVGVGEHGGVLELGLQGVDGEGDGGIGAVEPFGGDHLGDELALGGDGELADVLEPASGGDHEHGVAPGIDDLGVGDEGVGVGVEHRVDAMGAIDHGDGVVDEEAVVAQMGEGNNIVDALLA